MSVEKIREIVQETVDASGAGIEVDDDTSLIDGGILDSMSVVRMVQQLQQVFDINIDFSDVTVSNFDSISALKQYMASRSN